jgi:hypothetical protein
MIDIAAAMCNEFIFPLKTYLKMTKFPTTHFNNTILLRIGLKFVLLSRLSKHYCTKIIKTCVINYSAKFSLISKLAFS